MQPGNRTNGTAAVAVILLIIVVLAIVGIARHFWVGSAEKHFDALIAVYIAEKTEYSGEDREALHERLVEGGMFAKIHRWDRDSFIKDRALYQDMILTRDRREMREDKAKGSVMDTMINL